MQPSGESRWSPCQTWELATLLRFQLPNPGSVKSANPYLSMELRLTKWSSVEEEVVVKAAHVPSGDTQTREKCFESSPNPPSSACCVMLGTSYVLMAPARHEQACKFQN